MAGLTNLTELDLFGNNILDLSALAGLTNLTWLDLVVNDISDLSPLSGLTNLTGLELEDNSITDISSLSGLTNLTELDLSNNSITDISSLSGLTNLTELFLFSNNISDLSALAGLTNLTWLDLGVNAISDLSPVRGLTNLTELNLWRNEITDLSSVRGLTNLTWLSFESNRISDISAVSGLTHLELLFLGDNQIADLSALVANTGLGNGDQVLVTKNPLSATSLNTHVPALQSRGVQVSFDNPVPPALVKISGDNQKAATFAPLSQPFIVEAQDGNGAALEGVSVTFAVTVGGGTLSVQNTTTDANGRAQNTLTLGPSLGTNTVEVSAEGIEGIITFNAIADTEPPPIPTSVEPTDKLVLIMLGDIKRTALFQNYPNPFNPETWIPYHLSSDADVQLTIYDTQGAVVRQLDLGHQIAGYYTDRPKAAYWDGCNEFGETVASGIYFYQPPCR